MREPWPPDHPRLPKIERADFLTLPPGDVIVCPAKPESLPLLFSEGVWGYLMIRRAPRYLAIYVTAPTRRVKYFGHVLRITRPSQRLAELREGEAGPKFYGPKKRAIILEPGSLRELLDPIRRGERKRLQNVLYTTLARFATAATVDDL